MAKDDEEKLKKAIEVLKKTDFNAMSNLIILMLREYGRSIKAMGTLENNHKEAIEAIEIIGEYPEVMEEAMKKAPPEEIGLFTRIMIEMSMIQAQIEKFKDLPPKEKIALGEKIERISNELEQLSKKEEVKK
jgi:hypothetical protein